MSSIIKVTNLTKQFDQLKAVDRLSFSVPQGGIYGFLGQNGAGKSTTIRMLLTLVTPTEGSIEILGMDLQKHRKEILSQTGAIIEKPDLYKYLTAIENLRLFAAMSGKGISETKLMNQLELVGLAGRMNSKVKTFSQGMKQRLGIAIALIHDPQLVILDEPTNGLDPQGIADVRNMILHLSKNLGKTIFVSSHLLNEIEQIADSMLIIDKGKKMAEGKAGDLFNQEDMTVELQTPDNEATIQKLLQSQWKNKIKEYNDERIMVNLRLKDRSTFAKELIAMDIEILALYPRHSLEDYFLSLTTANQHVDSLKIELFKIFRRPRTYIAFIAIATIIFLIQLAFYADGETFMQFGMQSLKDNFDIKGKVLNGYLVCFIILQTLLIHVPLLIALVAGDAIAGEANMGTLRLVLTKPVSRTKFMLTKFFASVIYTLCLLLFMAVLALFLSLTIFGTSDLLIMKSDMIVILDSHDVMWRYFAAFGFAFLSMVTVGALAFLLSVFAENSIGPIVGTMSIVILFTILTTMNIPFFNVLKPFLFTNHMLNWKGFFENPVDYREVFKSGLVLIGHIALFLSAAIIIFNRKDILS